MLGPLTWIEIPENEVKRDVKEISGVDGRKKEY